MKNAAPFLFVLVVVFLLSGCEESELGKPPVLLVYEITDLLDDLLDVWFGGGEGWAVGPTGEEDVTALVVFFDGDDWQAVGGPIGDLSAVLGDGAGGCVAVGPEGLMTRYDGAQWTRYPNLTYEDLVAVDGVPEDYWIAGRNGVLINYDNGDWLLETVGEYNFTDVVATQDGVAAVTADGTVVIKDAGGTSTYDLGVGVSLNGIASAGGEGFVIVGDGGLILQGDGDDWTALSSPTNESLKDVSAMSAENFMAVGFQGVVVLSQGGKRWLLDSPTEKELTGVVLLSLNEGWIVGRSGIVLHYF